MYPFRLAINFSTPLFSLSVLVFQRVIFVPSVEFVRSLFLINKCFCPSVLPQISPILKHPKTPITIIVTIVLVVKSFISEFFRMRGSMSTVIGLLKVRVDASLVLRKCLRVVWTNQTSGASRKLCPRLNVSSDASENTYDLTVL